jgi:hypothetical protein
MYGAIKHLQRETVAHAFCHRVYIRLHTCMIERKEFSAAAIATLHLIGNQYGIMSSHTFLNQL